MEVSWEICLLLISFNAYVMANNYNSEDRIGEKRQHNHPTSTLGLKLVGKYSKRVLEVLRHFKEDYVSEAWGNTSWSFIANLISEEKDCEMVFCPSNPPFDEGVQNTNVSHDFLVVVSHLNSFEHVIIDESMHEHRSNLMNTFSLIMNEVKATARALEKVLICQGELPPSTSIADLTFDIYRRKGQFDRKIRQFSLLRQLHKQFHVLSRLV